MIKKRKKKIVYFCFEKQKEQQLLLHSCCCLPSNPLPKTKKHTTNKNHTHIPRKQRKFEITQGYHRHLPVDPVLPKTQPNPNLSSSPAQQTQCLCSAETWPPRQLLSVTLLSFPHFRKLFVSLSPNLASYWFVCGSAQKQKKLQFRKTMERSTPVRKPHTSTADLLTWSETPPADSPAVATPASRSAARSHQVTFWKLKNKKVMLLFG